VAGRDDRALVDQTHLAAAELTRADDGIVHVSQGSACGRADNDILCAIGQPAGTVIVKLAKFQPCTSTAVSAAVAVKE
jgi:hypothetical protein